jgi:hypothetical protein
MDELKPSPQLLIKLGSLIVHYQEWTSDAGHILDKSAIDSIERDEEFIQWIKQMDGNAFLPKKRKR